MKIELLNCHEKIDSMTNDAEKFEFKYTYEYRKRLELERQIRMLQSNTNAKIGEIGKTYKKINSELNSQLHSSDKSPIPLLKPGHTIIRAGSGTFGTK